LGLRYAVAIRANLTVWTPGARRARTVADIGKRRPARQWRRVCWGQGTKGPLAARFVALRVRPARSRGERWVLCERSWAKDEGKYYLLNLEASASLKALVTLARCRWPIEQQYRELKDELGWDHFEGRTFRGWNHHSVLTAMGFTFLQLERRRSPDDRPPTLPQIRFWIREIMAMLTSPAVATCCLSPSASSGTRHCGSDRECVYAPRLDHHPRRLVLDPERVLRGRCDADRPLP
jgi:SRSO17 transposase